jgi:hypothetical protein
MKRAWVVTPRPFRLAASVLLAVVQPELTALHQIDEGFLVGIPAAGLAVLGLGGAKLEGAGDAVDVHLGQGVLQGLLIDLLYQPPHNAGMKAISLLFCSWGCRGAC